MFTGSESTLKNLIKTNMTPLVTANLPDADAQQKALDNLDKTADALSKAIVTWILQAGSNSITATVAPGIALTAGTYAGSTTAPGNIINSSLK